jgi:hypothetical protein
MGKYFEVSTRNVARYSPTKSVVFVFLAVFAIEKAVFHYSIYKSVEAKPRVHSTAVTPHCNEFTPCKLVG